MIKRRFFKVEHADGNDASDTSSSSSDSEVEEPLEETREDDDVNDVPQVREHIESSSSSSSAYESEDSSAEEVEANLSDDTQSGEERRDAKRKKSSSSSRLLNAITNTVAGKDSVQLDEAYILKSKSVFKCRLCPRIICLTEESLNTHLKSKRHARSTRLLNEGRLKVMLNSDGEVEEDGETHAERLARTAATAQNLARSKKKNKGRQRQRNRQKKKKGDDSNLSPATPSVHDPPKKRLKGSQK